MHKSDMAIVAEEYLQLLMVLSRVGFVLDSPGNSLMHVVMLLSVQHGMFVKTVSTTMFTTMRL